MENKGKSARSRHAAVLVMSMSFFAAMGKGVEDGVGVAADRQLLGGLGPGTLERLIAGAREGLMRLIGNVGWLWA